MWTFLQEIHISQDVGLHQSEKTKKCVREREKGNTMEMAIFCSVILEVTYHNITYAMLYLFEAGHQFLPIFKWRVLHRV